MKLQIFIQPFDRIIVAENAFLQPFIRSNNTQFVTTNNNVQIIYLTAPEHPGGVRLTTTGFFPHRVFLEKFWIWHSHMLEQPFSWILTKCSLYWFRSRYSSICLSKKLLFFLMNLLVIGIHIRIWNNFSRVFK